MVGLFTDVANVSLMLKWNYEENVSLMLKWNYERN
jgi:hypothetical protein